MRTIKSRYLFILIPIVGTGTLAACTDGSDRVAASSDAGNDSATPSSSSTAPIDPPVKDASVDANTAAPLSCIGGSPLAIIGNWVAADGTQHWLKQTASALTYSRIPSGPAVNANPPILWNITQVCSDSRFFVAVSETSTYARIDWAEDSAGSKICIAVEGASDAKSVFALPLSVPGSATGCKGGAWTVLSRKDGGL